MIHNIVAHTAHGGGERTVLCPCQIHGADALAADVGDRENRDRRVVHGRHLRQNGYAEAERNVLQGGVALAHDEQNVRRDALLGEDLVHADAQAAGLVQQDDRLVCKVGEVDEAPLGQRMLLRNGKIERLLHDGDRFYSCG